MIAEIGHFALVLAMIVALVQSVLPMAGAARGNHSWMATAAPSAIVQFLCTAVAFGCLLYSFSVSDFTVINVAQNSNSLQPMIYKVSSTWGNHEGSMVLWVLILAMFGGMVAMFGGNLPEAAARYLEYDLIPTVYNMETARAVSEAATAPAPVYIKVDAGMGRLGIALGAAAVALLLVVIWLNSGDPDTPGAPANPAETSVTLDVNETPPPTAPAEDPPLLPSQATVNETPSADAGTIEPSPAASSPASSPPPTAAPSPPPTAGTPEPTETDTSERLRPDPQISRERVRQAMDSLRPSGAARGRGGFVPNNRERDLRRGRPNDPFPSSGTGTFLDRRVGARWTAASEPGQGFDGLLWVDANAYCNNLALAGLSDWRLPTRPELNSLLERLDPERYPWGLTLWSADRAAGDPNRLWVTNSPLFAPEWSNAVRDDSGRRLTHHAVCVSGP